MDIPFEVLRAKVIYGTQQPKKPKFSEVGFRTLSKVKIVD